MKIGREKRMKRYEPFGNISEQDAKLRIAEWFPRQAKLYAVLDFAVCFGIYDKGLFWVGLEGQATLTLMNWKYLREIRLFDEEKELFLVPSDCGWSGRMRKDAEDSGKENQTGEYVIDEWQKLWGKVKKNSNGVIPGWTLLVSGRGTNMQIPAELRGHEEAAIHVRRYMRVPDVEKEEELVFQNDIRMVNFCPWEGGGKDGK